MRACSEAWGVGCLACCRAGEARPEALKIAQKPTSAKLKKEDLRERVTHSDKNEMLQPNKRGPDALVELIADRINARDHAASSRKKGSKIDKHTTHLKS